MHKTEMLSNKWLFMMPLLLLFALVFLGAGCDQTNTNSTAGTTVEVTPLDKDEFMEKMENEEEDEEEEEELEEDDADEEAEGDEDVVEEEDEDDEEEESSASAGTVKEFAVSATKFDFTPSTITVNEGDTVKLSVTSEDVDHGIAISAFGVSEQVPVGETVEIEFVADKAGTYPFFCSVFCGSGHGAMKGTLVVQ
jgi:cytochrome c oxidase subunit II